MKGVGITLMILGVIALVIAFFFKTTVPSYSTFGSGSDVINIGLLQDQLMVWQFGLAAFVTGGLLFAAGSILASLQDGGVVPKPEASNVEVNGGKFCAWCGVNFKYPLTPCSYLTPQTLEDPSTKITLERCREELTARGIKYHTAD